MQPKPNLAPAPSARPLRARDRTVDLPDYLPARMLNEFVYCPRLFFYEWVEGVFAHSSDTVEGSLRHEKLERKADELPPAEELGEEGCRARSVELSSERYKLIARIDLVESRDGRVSPVDYKRGAPKEGAEGPEPWPPDVVQVIAQAMVLRDNGYRCDEAVLYYNKTRQRVRVAITEAAVRDFEQQLQAAVRTARRGRIPPPLVDSPKCPRCSLVSICLPDETTLTAATPQVVERTRQLWLLGELEEEPNLLEPCDEPVEREIRRLVPARDDLRPLYVTGHGLTVGKSGEVLQIRSAQEKKVQEARINEISQVNLFGNVTLTAPALQALCWAEKPISHFSYGGWFYGQTQGIVLKNVFLRQEQFRRAGNAAFSLALAKSIVATKIRNQRTLLQRNHVEPPAVVLKELRHIASRVAEVENMAELLGMEGNAARLYFEHFGGMIKAEEIEESPLNFDFKTRNRRPPRDPVNALLSFGYALLAKDLTIVCHAIGFDPYMGFYHQPRFGRPALSLDLMEGFRPLIADSVVLSAINTRMVNQKDFLRAGPAVSLTPAGRKAFIRAYEQRMDTLVTHPLFGYRVSYRRILEIQARLLARVISGELIRYQGFETR